MLCNSQIKVLFIRAVITSVLFGIGWSIGLFKSTIDGDIGIAMDVLFLITIVIFGVIYITVTCIYSKSAERICMNCLHERNKVKLPVNVTVTENQQTTVGHGSPENEYTVSPSSSPGADSLEIDPPNSDEETAL